MFLSTRVTSSATLLNLPITAKIVSDEVLDTAFEWLCHRRLKYSANNGIWSFHRNWSDEKTRIRLEVHSLWPQDQRGVAIKLDVRAL